MKHLGAKFIEGGLNLRGRIDSFALLVSRQELALDLRVLLSGGTELAQQPRLIVYQESLLDGFDVMFDGRVVLTKSIETLLGSGATRLEPPAGSRTNADIENSSVIV
jgi:hypothetical protein